jgi:cell division protein FtsB
MKHTRDNRSWWRRFLCSPLALGINLVLVGFVGWSLLREMGQGRNVSDNLNSLRKQIAGLEERDRDYSSTLAKLGTPAYIEQEARLKLGYQKPGEQVLLLRNVAPVADSAPVASAAPSANLSNPAKWWRYFFGDK